MPRRQRTMAWELKQLALRALVVAVFLAIVLGVLLPLATEYLTDAATQQFLPSPSVPAPS